MREPQLADRADREQHGASRRAAAAHQNDSSASGRSALCARLRAATSGRPRSSWTASGARPAARPHTARRSPQLGTAARRSFLQRSGSLKLPWPAQKCQAGALVRLPRDAACGRWLSAVRLRDFRSSGRLWTVHMHCSQPLSGLGWAAVSQADRAGARVGGARAPEGIRSYICQQVRVRLTATSVYLAALAPVTAPSATPSARLPAGGGRGVRLGPQIVQACKAAAAAASFHPAQGGYACDATWPGQACRVHMDAQRRCARERHAAPACARGRRRCARRMRYTAALALAAASELGDAASEVLGLVLDGPKIHGPGRRVRVRAAPGR